LIRLAFGCEVKEVDQKVVTQRSQFQGDALSNAATRSSDNCCGSVCHLDNPLLNLLFEKFIYFVRSPHSVGNGCHHCRCASDKITAGENARPGCRQRPFFRLDQAAL
jgi:hypothetical protein